MTPHKASNESNQSKGSAESPRLVSWSSRPSGDISNPEDLEISLISYRSTPIYKNKICFEASNRWVGLFKMKILWKTQSLLILDLSNFCNQDRTQRQKNLQWAGKREKILSISNSGSGFEVEVMDAGYHTSSCKCWPRKSMDRLLTTLLLPTSATPSDQPTVY